MKSRRDFVRIGVGAALTLQSAPAQENLEEAALVGLQEGLITSRWTSVQLVEKYLARISEIDKSGPRLNSVIELNPEAQSIAAALDRERKEKGVRGPLHGIPVMIKDNIDTAAIR
jgi:amidase